MRVWKMSPDEAKAKMIARLRDLIDDVPKCDPESHEGRNELLAAAQEIACVIGIYCMAERLAAKPEE